MESNFYCEKCSLKFDDKIVYDLHFCTDDITSLLHSVQKASNKQQLMIEKKLIKKQHDFLIHKKIVEPSKGKLKVGIFKSLVSNTVNLTAGQ